MTKQKTNRKNNDNSSYRITPTQGLAINTSTIIGVGVLTLPRSTTDSAHQYGWIPVLAALLLTVLAVCIITVLGRRFPGKSMVAYTAEVFGSRKHPWVGRVLSMPVVLLYVAYWWFVTALVARMFGEVVVTAVLINTPLEVIVGTMLILCLLLVYYDVEVVARVHEVLLPIIVVPVLFISLSAYQSAQMEYIMPLLPPSGHHWKGVIIAIMPALTSFLGFESQMMFNRNLRVDKRMLRYQIWGVVVPGMLYLLIVIAGIMNFGFEELSHLAWPTLELVKTVNVPGLILERMEAVFLSVWVAAVFTTAGTMFYCAKWSLSELFRLPKKWWIPLVLIIGIYILAMRIGENIEQLFKVLEWVGYLGIILVFVVPGLILLLAMIRKIDGRQQKSQEEQTHEAG
jgi:spore germination protein